MEILIYRKSLNVPYSNTAYSNMNEYLFVLLENYNSPKEREWASSFSGFYSKFRIRPVLYFSLCTGSLSDQGCVQRLDYCDPNHVLFNGTSTQPQLINSFRKKIN